MRVTKPTTISVSAPGKIHLMGEHAVVYGRPAVLMAINRRMVVSCRLFQPKADRLLDEVVGERENSLTISTTENDQLVRHAVEVFQKAYAIEKLPPLEITVVSELPAGSGMGSSAAVAAATIGALMKAVKGLWNPIRIHELAYEVEKFAHGNPSGADVTTVVHGGLVWFRKEFEFLKSIWTLPLGQYAIPRFVLIDTGTPEETTKDMVALVENRRSHHRANIDAVFSDQEDQAKRLVLSLRSADTSGAIAAIRQGERNLEQLGVVGHKAQRIIRDIESAGGAAKISGAGGAKGGSGMLLCYHADVKKIETIAEKHGVPTMGVEVSEDGVRLEKRL